MAKRVIRFRESIPYSTLQFEADKRLIREYCFQTNCSECIMIKNGLTGCRDTSEYLHPLNDAMYVKACADLLIKDGFNGGSEYVKNFLDRIGL